ncbi:hypothetical protein TrVE_jg2750 [Triparma verrucosa]|uniref:Calpain catalytic domain-containing protein n=1 Tax=Triparma verrucosa TaxID=1606542 RepID=A0A9W7CKE3_9STRA|nr:hypothetical protein TrVE_jg2750 [Triparma verrucosa]
MAEFELAFTLLEEATRLDTDNPANVAGVIEKYQLALNEFSGILDGSSDTLDSNITRLIGENINKYNERVQELYRQLPVASAEAKLVDDDVAQCRMEKDGEELHIPIASLVVEEDWEIMAEAEAKDDPDDRSERGSSVNADAKELQRRHEQRQEQRRLGSAASTALTAALTMDEQLCDKIGEDDSNISSTLKEEAKAVTNAYLEAAQLYLESLKCMESSAKENNLAAGRSLVAVKNRVEEVLDRVEQLKAGKLVGVDRKRSESSASFSSSPTRSSSSRPPSLTKEEIEVLKISSRIGSKTFMPFVDTDVNARAFTTLGEQEYEDVDGLLKLSDSQKRHFYKWARPSEIAQRQRKHVCMYHTISPYTIKQTLVTDCSFIASLCIAASYERRFRKRLVTAIIYPQNKKGTPIYNECGKYIVKLWLNGVARRVIIDDRLPVDRNFNLICSHTTNNTHLELWVSLLEKAFLKLTGAMSYAFPGSNSGIDLYSLTGWVPERLYFGDGKKGKNRGMEDHETSPERIFQRLNSAFSFGDCLTTASVSDQIGTAEAEGVGLVTQHAYGILDVREVSSGRFIFMKNPWSSKGWKGRFSPHDGSWTEKIGRELGYDYVKARQCTDTGLFWICWDDFKAYFTSVHLNWNPSLFKYKYTTHGYWDKSMGPANDKFCVDENPQYVLIPSEESIQKKATFYILLTRHVDVSEQRGDESNDFLTTFVYANGGRRVIYPHEKVVVNGIFSSNPHVLIRLDASSRHKVLNLVLRQYKKERSITYSLSVYCTSNFSFGPLKDNGVNKFKLTGGWNPSGGTSGRSGMFYQNPQYRVEVGGSKPIEMSAVLKTNPQLSVSLSFVKGGRRVDYIGRDNEVLSSGDYRGAVALCRGKLQPGTYTMIASTWNAGETGGFVINFEGAMKIAEIKQESEMMPHTYKWNARWTHETGVGCANYNRYTENLRIEFEVGSAGEIFGRLAVVGGGGRGIAINASIFELKGGFLDPSASSVGKSCGLVSSSNDGIYKSASGGVTFHFRVKPNVRYACVVSTFEPESGVDFRLDMHSNVKLASVKGGLKKIK